LGPRAFAFGLLAITVAAFAFRLTLLGSIASTDPAGGDPYYYHAQANLLVEGHGFSDPFRLKDTLAEDPPRAVYEPVAIHPPLFTLWLAIPSAVGFKGYLAHKVMSCLAGALAVAAIGLFGREVAGGRAGLLAAALAAVYPPLWSIDGQLWPEGLFTALVAASCALALRARARPGWRWAAATGVAVGLATSTRGEAIALLPLLVLPALAWGAGPLRRRLPDLAVAGTACLVVLAPWAVRNATTFDHPVWISTNSDEVFVYANNPYAYGTADGGRFLGFWYYPWQDELRARHGEPPGDASQKARYWREQGVDYATAHKGRWPVVAAARLGRAWNVYAPFQNAAFDKIDGKSEAVSRAGVWAWWAVLLGSVPGVIVLRRRGVTLVPFAALAVTVSATAIYAYGANRFRTPLEVGALVLTAVAIDAAWRRRTSDATTSSAAASGGAA
jgi:4-amino-4-deoxy-L-arabinose transferase-like glycosyltransferase